MHTVFALLCFVVVIHWLIFPYPSGLLHWHCGNLTIAPMPAKQPWWIWINTSCEFIMNDCITTTKQSTTKPCAYFLGYTVIMHGQLMAVWVWPKALMALSDWLVVKWSIFGAKILSFKIWISAGYTFYRNILSNWSDMRQIAYELDYLIFQQHLTGL